MEESLNKILIVGGGYADIPLILAAKKLRYYVITTGNRPDDLGHKYSDEYHNADFSDCEAIYNLAKSLMITAICPGCNDFAALSSAYTAEKLGLHGHDSFELSKIIHHKDKYRQFAKENNILSPKAVGFNDKEKALKIIKEHSLQLKLPLIVKPIDLSGGKGISVINNFTEAENAIEKAFAVSKAKRIVIEEYIEGSRHGFSSMLVNGKVKFNFIDNEHYYLNKYMVSAASTSTIASEEVEKKLCVASEKIASLLNLKDGIFHVQFILKDNEPYIIEICRRPPGDLYIKFVEYATNFDYPMWIVKSFAGMDISEIKECKANGFYTRHCIMTSSPCEVKNIIYDENIKKNIINEFTWWKEGDLIVDYMTNKLGIVFLKFDSMSEMIYKTGKLNELIKIIVK